MEKINLSWDEVQELTREKVRELRQHTDQFTVYGVPRGGIQVALLFYWAGVIEKVKISITETPEEADVIVDDIIDSGSTRLRYMAKYNPKTFVALINKLERPCSFKNKWVSFPWERMTEEAGPEENIRRLLEYIGEDPNREGLKETPARVVRSFEKLYGGYKQDPKDILKTFTEGSCDEMVVLKNIEFYSCCEHHMLPFSGVAHIAYIPNRRVVGISKLARLLEIYARRLQIQERLCQQITAALDDILKPKGSACIIEAQHTCMTSRGVEKQKSIMITSSLTGAFKTSNETRNELLHIVRG